MPWVWDEVYRRLRDAAAKAELPPPPVPLILAGWDVSSDAEKQDRWRDTVAWAEKNGMNPSLTNIDERSMYVVDQLSYRAPTYSYLRFEPKPRADGAARAKMLATLRTKWAEIAGPALAAYTSPLRFTGKKGRRLLVLVKTDEAPPWGSWTSLAYDSRKRNFTAFRKAINLCIAPHEVDHVDFKIVLGPAAG
jgi:hypothetical protein